MKCPKCLYIGFDHGDRCRNCGYEFSLAVDVEALDLPMQTGNEPLGPLADLSLAALDHAFPQTVPPREAAARSPEPAAAGVRAPAAPPSGPLTARRPVTGTGDLPLFRDRGVPDDAPLVVPPAVPRAPLSVRRATPAVPRTRTHPIARDSSLDLELSDLEERVTPAERRARRGPDNPPGALTAAAAPPDVPAAALPRLAAAAIDALILGAINLAVLYFTLRLTRLGFADLDLLPPIPLGGYLLLLNGGYFVLFTAAGGQTIGKMAMAIRVVPADAEGRALERVPLGHAIVRVAGYAVSLLPLGLGYLPAVVGQERRAIHDRLADTRVVNA